MFGVDLKKLLTRCGFKLATVAVGEVERNIVVKDEEIVEPELKPVAIGGQPVEE